MKGDRKIAPKAGHRTRQLHGNERQFKRRSRFAGKPEESYLV